MTAVAARSMPLAVGWIGDIVRGWNRRTSTLAVAMGAITLLDAGVPLAFPINDGHDALAAFLYNVLQFGFPLVFATQLADRAVDHGASALRAYALAVVLTGQAGVWIIGPLLAPVLGKAPWWGLDDDLMQIGRTLMLHGLCVGAYAQWRGERAARERLQARERDRATAQSQLITSRLLALQARVDPQLLFDALGHIDAALARDDDAADRQLADLISLLRAMQPAVRQRISTLARELALIAAHARVSGTPGLQPQALQIVASDVAADARLAPLVLLPLLRCLTALHPARWQLDARVAGGRLVIEVAAMDDAGASRADAALKIPDIDELRERLVAVHGSTAELRVDPGFARLFIEVDADHDEHPDRRG